MWEQYRKTLIPTQIIIAVVCLCMILIFKSPWQGILAVFTAMEIGAILGARWALRLKRKVQTARDRLPLQPR